MLKIKSLIVIVLIFGAFLNLNAQGFKKVATVKPVLVQEGSQKNWCPICGMSIKMFYKTSHASKLKNGTDRQYCSIRCLAVDMQEYNIDLNSVRVVDATTQKLIFAKDAFYVVGSKVKGTMTKVSKLAFATKDEAEKFRKKYGGKVVTFQKALVMATESLKSDIAMINKKKKKKVYPMGKKILAKMCKKDINPFDYVEINQLKSAIKNNKLCKPLKEKQLQAVSLYLWEVLRANVQSKNHQRVHVEHDEKCPVCGMFVYKYPRWAAQIFYKDGTKEAHFSFDGVKDMMKFYFEPTKWGDFEIKNKRDITNVVVTDYYTQRGIDARDAYYVIGSNVYGPMGKELIPFENKEDAKTFMTDHNGKEILKFEEITKKGIYKLDE